MFFFKVSANSGYIQIQHLLKLNCTSIAVAVNQLNSNTTLVKVKFSGQKVAEYGFRFKYNTC